MKEKRTHKASFVQSEKKIKEDKASSSNRIFEISLITFMVLMYIISCYAKRPSSFLYPQFIAEDGCVFYQDAINIGWKSIFIVYGGYYDILIRLVAYLSTVFIDIEYAPHFFNASTFALTVMATLYIWFRVKEDNIVKYLLCITFLLGPYSSEIYMWLTMVHFILPVLLLIPFIYPSNSIKLICIDAVVILVLGLTGAHSAILLPVVLIAIIYGLLTKYNSSSKGILIVGSVYIVVALVQFYYIYRDGIDNRTLGTGEVNMDSIVFYSYHFFYDNVVSIIGSPELFFYKNTNTYKLVTYLFLGYYIFAFVKMCKSFSKGNEEKYFKIFIYLTAFIVCAFSTIYAWKKLPFAIVPPQNTAGRYLVVPTCMFLFAIITNISPKKRAWMVPFLIVYIISIFSYHNWLKKKKYLYDDNLNWKETVMRYKRGEICELPTPYVGTHSVKIKNCSVSDTTKVRN